MNKIITPGILVFIAMLGFSIPATSQVNIKVEQVNETMSKGENAGFKVAIPQATMEEVKKAWVKLLQKDVKAKATDTGLEISITGAKAGEVSTTPVNIYSILRRADSSILLTAFFEIDSQFFDPATCPDPLVKEKTLIGIQNYLRHFAVEQYTHAVEEELNAEENKLADLNKQLNNLKNEEEKAEKSIKEEESSISSAEDEIRVLKAQSTQQSEQVQAKRLANLAITDKEAKKTAEKELKDLEKEKDKTDKQIEKLEKGKITSKNNIEDYEKEIKESQEQQETVSSQIEAQEAVVEEVEAKLKGII